MNGRHYLFYSTHSSSFSKHVAYITHNATEPLIDITIWNLSDCVQIEVFILLFWWSCPLSGHVLFVFPHSRVLWGFVSSINSHSSIIVWSKTNSGLAPPRDSDPQKADRSVFNEWCEKKNTSGEHKRAHTSSFTLQSISEERVLCTHSAHTELFHSYPDHSSSSTDVEIFGACICVCVCFSRPLSLIQKASRCAPSTVAFSVLTSTAFGALPAALHTVVLQINW